MSGRQNTALAAAAAAATLVALWLRLLPCFAAHARARCCWHSPTPVIHPPPHPHPHAPLIDSLQIHDELLLEVDGSLDVRWVAQASSGAPAPAAPLPPSCALYLVHGL